MNKCRITMGISNIFFSVRYIYLLLLIFELLSLSNCLFEDQVGKFDWKHSFIGKLKYSHFENITNARRIIVGTEENVLAALHYKSGDIIWRNVLECGARGNIAFLYVDKEVVTITGEYPFVVRGWDVRTGSSLWEWSLQLLNKDQPNVKHSWLVSNGDLYHVLQVSNSHIELTRYELQTGSNEHSTQKIPASWISSRCILITSHYVCPSEDYLIGFDLLSSDSQTFKVHLGSNFNGIIHATKGSFPGIIANKKLYAIKNNMLTEFMNTYHEHGTLVPLLLNGEEVVMHSYVENKLLHMIGYQHKNEGKFNVGQSLSYPENFANPQVADMVCSQKGPKIMCSTLYHTDDNVLFLRVQDKIVWHREESLSDISAVRMIDLPLNEDGLQSALKRAGDSLEMFGKRIYLQITHLKYFFVSLFGVDTSKLQRQGLVRDSFGLHKMIVVVTSVGKVLGIDNIDATVLWSRYIPVLAKKSANFYIELLEQRTTKYYPHDPQCVIIGNNQDTNKGFIFQFNPITGKDMDGGFMNLPFVIKQYMLLPENDDNLKGLLILDDQDVPHIYPMSSQHFAIGIYLYTISKMSGNATGFLIEKRQQNVFALPIWSLKLTAPNHIVTHIATKNIIERVNSQGRVLADRSVLYKYLNPNLVAIVTQGSDPIHKCMTMDIMNVLLLDVVSGKIVSATSHIRAKEPIHIVHSENWLVYSYFNDKSRRTEIGAMEMYEGKTQPNTTTWSSYRASQPMVEIQTYIFPAQIDALRETITIRGITAKHVLIGTSFGSVLEMPWIFLDPRRPVTITGEARDEGVLPYVPELPMPSEGIVNYNQSIERIKDIVAIPSGLESTCLVLVHGLDMFYTRVAPSQTFDLLKEDFDYLMIMIVLSVLSVTVFTTKHLANRRALRQAWH